MAKNVKELVPFKKYVNNDVIKQYSAKENVQLQVAIHHFEAMKHFLKFASSTKRSCFPSKELDGVWHTFILFTKDYYSFCNNYLGSFVHHIPFISEEDKIKKFTPGYYCFLEKQKFKKVYVRSLSELGKTIKEQCGTGGDCTTNCGKCRIGDDE